MTRALAAAAAAALLVACSGADQARPSRRTTTSSASSTSTTTSTTTPSTSPAPTTTVLTAPPVTTNLAGARAVISPAGVVVPVLGFDPRGVRVGTPCGYTSVLGAGRPIKAVDVVLDPGHGGSESGAVGPNRLTEKAANLAVAQHAKAALEAAGVSLVLSRTADYRMTLDARAALVRALQPKAFVSVHHNADPDGPHEGPGSETYYQVASAPSKRMAGLIYEEVVRALAPFAVSWVGDTDAGAKYRLNTRGGDYYAMLRQTAGTPATLAELAFITNPPEADLVARTDVQRVEGEAVARGIVRFLRTNDPGSGFTTPYERTTPTPPSGGQKGCIDPPL